MRARCAARRHACEVWRASDDAAYVKAAMRNATRSRAQLRQLLVEDMLRKRVKMREVRRA